MEPYGFFIVMGLIISGVLGTIWMTPLISVGRSLISLILLPFTG